MKALIVAAVIVAIGLVYFITPNSWYTLNYQPTTLTNDGSTDTIPWWKSVILDLNIVETDPVASADVATLETKVNGFDSRITDADGRALEAKAAIAALETGKVADLEADIAYLRGTLDHVSKIVTGQENGRGAGGLYAQVKEHYVDLNGRFDDSDPDNVINIAGLKKTVLGYAGGATRPAIEGLVDRVDTNAGDIGVNAHNIGANHSLAATNAEDIAANQSAIEQLTLDVSKIGKMARGTRFELESFFRGRLIRDGYDVADAKTIAHDMVWSPKPMIEGYFSSRDLQMAHRKVITGDKDDDNDGILNKDDECLDTIAGDYPDPDRAGCPGTPPRQAHVVTDGDPIGDLLAGLENKTVKPEGEEGEKEIIELPDMDGDGVPDITDDDMDGDGFLNDFDACPESAGPNRFGKKKDGCPKK